jgi:hypothetical protein
LALFCWWRWWFSPGRLSFADSATGDIRIITIQDRRQNITGNRRFPRTIEHWRKPAACHPFAMNNSLRPRFDLKRMIDGNPKAHFEEPCGRNHSLWIRKSRC